MRPPTHQRRRSFFLGASALASCLVLTVSCSSGGEEVQGTTTPGTGGGLPGTSGLPPHRPQLPQRADGFELGDPIPGLTPTELAAFERGRAVFERRFKPSEGLGPFYNAASCQSCHSTPSSGGSARLYRNFYIAVWGTETAQTAIPPFLGPVVPAFGSGPAHASATFTLEGGRPTIPDTYAGFPVTVGQRNAIPVFGTGLFEFVSNATILAHADPEDLDGDGVSGRYNTEGGALGRLGVKAQSNNIESFTRAPLQNQMGITTDPFLGSGAIVSMKAAQATGGPDDPTEDMDGVPDPELSHDDLGDLIAFTRFLAPPRPKILLAAGQNGRQLFEAVGCTKCHVPSLPSSRGPVNAYTDLLIHDMGPDLADGLNFGMPQASPSSPPHTGQEFRTQPLWGVSLHGPFLHDGRAETLQEAIEMHGGEAAAIRDAYLALTLGEQADIITFLEAL